MTGGALSFLFCAILLSFCSCGGKPSKSDISRKILLDYVCNETAKVNNLKILRTEKTESTGEPPMFRYAVSGEVEWPDGCTESGTTTPPGTKEKFERLVTLYQSDEGQWQ
jgi:hypothetical protein